MRRLALLLALVLAPAAAASPVTRGEHLYGQYCLACHVSPATAPPLAGVGAAAADFYLRTGYMPLPRLGVLPHRSRVLLSDAQIRDLVAYVASLGPGPPIPQPNPERGSLAAGMHAFTDRCAGCHQIVAAGGYLPDVVPPPLADATAVQIAEAVRVGPNVMPRFSRAAISDGELDSIIRYVEYAKHPDDRGGWAIGHLGPVPEGLVTWLLAAAVLVATCLALGKRLSG